MRIVCVVLGSTLVLGGCSAVFVNQPPTGEGPLPEGACTTSQAMPLLDAVGSVAYAAATVLSDHDLEDIGLSSGTGARITSAGMAGGLAYSALIGFRSTSKCRERQRLSRREIAAHVRTLVSSTPGWSLGESYVLLDCGRCLGASAFPVPPSTVAPIAADGW